MDDGAWLVSVMRAACAEALALVLPVACAGCDEPDIALCEACRAELRPRVTRSGQRVGVWSGLAFAGVPARVVRALKEEGRTGLARDLAPALRAAVEAALRAASEGIEGAGDAASVRHGVVLVPIPTSRAAFRRRGYRVVELVAHRAGLRTARVLHPSRATADQRGLGREARRANVAHSLGAKGAKGLRVVLIDDVVTTGATIDEAVRALRAGGADVLGAATIAATERHHGQVDSR